MMTYGDPCTDQELCDLLDFDSVEDMIASAAGKRGMLFIQTCSGQWMKYEADKIWTFNKDTPE